MDVLSAVMRELRFQAAGYRRLELSAPWAISFAQQGLRGIHIVLQGRCEMQIWGDEPRMLDTGDLVIAPRADAHVLRSVDGGHLEPISAMELATRSEGGRIRVTGSGEETVVVCGAFVFHEGDHPALGALPRIVHVRAENGQPPKWLAAYIEALTTEAFDEGPGSATVMARLSAALIAKALRHHADQVRDPGWLMGLQDPHVAKALALLHEDFKSPWTLAELARRVGLSRAAFAKRFSEKVGETPMRYLLGCRMRHAALLLDEKRTTLARVAAQVGYGSEAAFSAAFKRYAGTRPGEYRRAEAAPSAQREQPGA
jgi:AraC-like DNA-binding protein